MCSDRLPTPFQVSRAKTKPEDLALLGGPPAFSSVLHVGRPNVGNREALLARIGDMLDRRWFSNRGPLVEEFEQRIAAYLGVKHAISVCNATIGLEVALCATRAAGEVIVPAYTFVATAHAAQWRGLTPVFADIDPATHNLDPKLIERHITPRTTAIVGTHLWGRPCAVSSLEEIAKRNGLALIFDAAHAFGCSEGGRMLGGNGTAEVFSFHATKFLNSFEGGAICTNDDALAQRARLMVNFGFSGYDNVIHAGTNGKMTEVCAAMGLTSLEAVGDLIAVNRENYLRYAGNLAGIPGISLIAYDDRERNNYQYIVIEIDESRAGIRRDTLIRVLHAENVLARKYFWPGCHRMEPYRSLVPDAARFLPATEAIAARVVVLPTGQTVGADTIDAVCGIVRAAVNGGARLEQPAG